MNESIASKQETAKRIMDKAYITGTFTLRSGQISSEYFDKYLFESEPALLNEIASSMALLIPEDTEVLAGLEMGGIPIATALSLETGKPCAFIRKKAKTHGTCKFAEGINVNGKKVCIVEDVVTTGGQIIESARELRNIGAIIDTVVCAILRDEKAIMLLSGEDLTLKSTFTMYELKNANKEVI